MAVGEEVIEEWGQEFEIDKKRFQDNKPIHEDQDIIRWKELRSYKNSKYIFKR